MSYPSSRNQDAYVPDPDKRVCDHPGCLYPPERFMFVCGRWVYFCATHDREYHPGIYTLKEEEQSRVSGRNNTVNTQKYDFNSPIGV